MQQYMEIVSRTAGPPEEQPPLAARLAHHSLPVQDALEKFASIFPGLLVQSGYLPCFDEVERIFASPPLEPRLVAGRDLLIAVARDDNLYETVRAETDGLLGLTGPSRLLRLAESRVVRGVGAQSDELRYVETHLSGDGKSVLGVSSLTLGNGLRTPGKLFRKLAGFADEGSAPWRFETVIRHEAALLEAGDADPDKDRLGNIYAAGAVPDSDLFVSLASRFLSFVKPLALKLGGGINLRPAEGGVYFDIRSDKHAAGEAERFMTLGGAGGANLWLSA